MVPRRQPVSCPFHSSGPLGGVNPQRILCRGMENAFGLDMSTYLNEVQLQHMVLEKYGSGRLPLKLRGETWAGRAGGVPCALCDGAINSDEVEYEWRVNNEDGSGSLRFHLGCFRSWGLVSARLPGGVNCGGGQFFFSCDR